MKISGRTETIFAQAVALHQSGRLKSSIHVKEKKIFIVNFDNTILLKFESDQDFGEGFSFFANDYESNEMSIKEGKIVFTSYSKGNKREKICPQPQQTFEEILDIWNKYNSEGQKISFHSSIIELLEEGLSHVEIEKNPKLKIIQRDIYTGSRIEIEREEDEKDSFLSVLDEDFSFPTIGLRTPDFKSLFAFVDNINFFVKENRHWIFLKSDKYEGVISTCLYDELGYMED